MKNACEQFDWFLLDFKTSQTSKINWKIDRMGIFPKEKTCENCKWQSQRMVNPLLCKIRIYRIIFHFKYFCNRIVLLLSLDFYLLKSFTKFSYYIQNPLSLINTFAWNIFHRVYYTLKFGTFLFSRSAVHLPYFKYKFRIYTWTLLAVERPLSWAGGFCGAGEGPPGIACQSVRHRRERHRWGTRTKGLPVTFKCVACHSAAADSSILAEGCLRSKSEFWVLNPEGSSFGSGVCRQETRQNAEGENPEGCPVNLHFIYAYFLGVMPSKTKIKKTKHTTFALITIN